MISCEQIWRTCINSLAIWLILKLCQLAIQYNYCSLWCLEVSQFYILSGVLYYRIESPYDNTPLSYNIVIRLLLLKCIAGKIDNKLMHILKVWRVVWLWTSHRLLISCFVMMMKLNLYIKLTELIDWVFYVTTTEKPLTNIINDSLIDPI